MKKLIFLCLVVISTAYACKKQDQRTGVELNIQGAPNYYMQVLVGTPVNEITDIDTWRPDAAFWASTSNGFVELGIGQYTLVLKNIQTGKIISIPANVKPSQVTQINGSL